MSPLLERQPGWDALRLDAPGGLQELLEVLRSQAWNPELTLEQQLDRRQSGLGAELSAALEAAPSRGACAIRAAFALYGPSASEWLSEEPRRVVQELARRLERLQQRRHRQEAWSGATGADSNAQQGSEPRSETSDHKRESPSPSNPHHAALE
ncbi:MAG: molecular chaperone DnaJ, partial [Cyanobium sp.]